ncbi:MAG: tRNA (adenosine(37)-N6)-dimethylallyltransferase MiaA, partial [Treponema sp.]|nr:tRNA (adenosine(37)-N6)-dimethylallyltransferase MiaA [Treponema sp.]
NIIARKKLPIVVGGTGMYLDSIIRNYNMIEVPENKERHEELEKKSLEELNELLLKLRPNLHTLEDLRNKDRCIKAIQIAECMKNFNSKKQNGEFFFVSKNARPDIRPLVIGTTLERQELRERISKRLKERLDSGMIEEVSRLHEEGASWNRLEVLGLEYKFVAEFLQGKIASKDELFEKLNIAIRQFAKRQETWFRGMERKMQKIGMQIFWLSKVEDVNVRFKEAKELIEKHCSGHF